MLNGWRYLLYLTLIYRELGVELEMHKVNNAYELKQNPTDTIRVYMSAKQVEVLMWPSLRMRRIGNNNSSM